MKRIFINTGSNILVVFAKLIITFIMTPVLIKNLGNYDYGLWEMLIGVIGYMGMLNIGIPPAIARFASKYKAENSRSNLLDLYNTGFIYLLAIGITLLLCFSFWGWYFPHTIAPEGGDLARYTMLLLIIGFQLLLIFPGLVAESFLEGFQFYYLKNNVTIINSVVGSFIIYYTITPENGIMLLAGLNALGLGIKYIIFFMFVSTSEYGGMRFELSRFSWARLIELTIFGAKSMVQGVATRIEQATDTIIIGIILGPAMVPFYSIPANLVRYISTITMNLTHAFMPLFSDLNARNANDQITRIYLLGSKFVIGLVSPLAISLIIIGGPFISLWVGLEYGANADWIIFLLVMFITFPYINPFYSRLLTALNQHGILARLSPISAAINLGLTIVLVNQYGIVGAALGSVVPVLIFVPIYLVYTCRSLKLQPQQYILASLIPSLIPTFAMVAVLLYYRINIGITSYPDIFAVGMLGLVVYSALFWMLSMKENEKSVVRDIIRSRIGGK